MLYDKLIKWALGAALVVTLCGVSHCAGRAKVQAEWDASRAKGKQIVADLKASAGRETVKVEVRYVDRIKEIEVKGETITRYVNKYIPVGSGCTTDGMLDGAFRVLHDGAASNTVPDPTAIAAGAATTVADVASTVTDNYAQCHKAYARVTAWEEWAAAQCALNANGCPVDE